MAFSECGTYTGIKPIEMKRSVSRFVLIVLLILLALGAIPAGLSLIIDPTGGGIGLPLSTLEFSPFRNFLVPGLFLFLILGLFPVLIVYGLIRQKQLAWFSRINPDKKEHWALSSSFYMGLILILWISVQLLMGVTHDILHFVYTLLGILIVILSKLAATSHH